MRSIPTTLKSKLRNRFKAESTDSAPNIRLVATQTSVNTLLTEPIHEDIPAAFGDVCVSQTAGDDDVALAYAVCLDNGIATVWRRKFPASMDYKWEQVFAVGAAEDAAIEFDGTWKMNGEHEWYYLETEQFPYIFTVEGGNLYVQKWRDTTTRQLLAENISQISVCKGWTDSTDPDDDQGLIVGYLRNGEVFYRSLAYSSVAGYKSWEVEQQVTELGADNETLSVIRTNDFRIGFLTEKAGVMQMALTGRTYPGMSVKPEGAHVSANAMFSYKDISRKTSYFRESTVPSVSKFFFLMDGTTDSRIAITGAERILAEDKSCMGVKVYLDHPLTTDLTAAFVSGCKCSYSNVTVSGVAYDAAEQALIYSFTWKSGITPHKMAVAFTVSYPTDFNIRYIARDGMEWYIESASVELPQVTETHYGYAAPETAATAVTKATLSYVTAVYSDGFMREGASVAVSSVTFTYVPAGDIPL